MTIALIPTCGESEHLVRLVKSQAGPSVDVVVVVNNCTPRRAGMITSICMREGASSVLWDSNLSNIYSIWRWGAELAQAQERYLAVLNDDIALPPMSVAQMEQVMLENPDYGAIGWDYWHPDLNRFDYVRKVSGSYRKGGVGGFAFMFNPESHALPDPEFGWWGGDDDWFNQIRQDGLRLGVAMGMGVKHWPSTSSSRRPEVLQSIEQDRCRMLAKWGEAW